MAMSLPITWAQAMAAADLMCASARMNDLGRRKPLIEKLSTARYV